MKVWLVTCLILFASVQFYEWAKGFILPLPIYVLAGAFLSLASNYGKIPSLPIQTIIDDQISETQE